MFNVGDKVILKSGGPVMTVALPPRIDKGRIEAGKVLCKWYNEKTGQYERRYFEEGVLELYKEPEEEQKREIGYK